MSDATTTDYPVRPYRMSSEQLSDCLAAGQVLDRIKKYPDGVQFVTDLFISIIATEGLTIADEDEVKRLHTQHAEMLAALKAVDKFLLVIESAVRHDAPSDLGPVTAALKSVAAAVAKAEGRES